MHGKKKYEKKNLGKKSPYFLKFQDYGLQRKPISTPNLAILRNLCGIPHFCGNMQFCAKFEYLILFPRKHNPGTVNKVSE